jgi:hypothetical protein
MAYKGASENVFDTAKSQLHRFTFAYLSNNNPIGKVRTLKQEC